MLRNKLFLNILFVFIALILIISYCGNNESFYYNPDEFKTTISNETIISSTTLITTYHTTDTTTSIQQTGLSTVPTTTISGNTSSTYVSSQNSTTSSEQTSNTTSNTTTTLSSQSFSTSSNSTSNGSTTSNSSTSSTTTTSTTTTIPTTTTTTTTTTIDCSSFNSSTVLISLQPTNGLEGSSFKVSWTDISSGESYIVDLMQSTGSTYMSGVCTVAQGVQTCSYTITSTGTYFYRITAKKAGCTDKYVDSNTFTVSVNCSIFNANTCSFNIQPTNGVSGSSFTVSWNPIAGASEYVLDLCSTSGTSVQAGVCSGTSSLLSCSPPITLIGAYTFKLTAKKTGCSDKTCNSSAFYVINGVVRDCLNPINLNSVSFPHSETGTFMGTWQVPSNCGVSSNHMIVYSFTPTADGKYMINCTNNYSGSASSWISIFAYSCTNSEIFCCGYAAKSLQTRVLDVMGGIPYYIIFYTGSQNQLLINPVIKISVPPTPLAGDTCTTSQVISGSTRTLITASTIEYDHPDILCSWSPGPLNWMSYNLSALSDVLTVNLSTTASGAFFLDCTNMLGCFSFTNSAIISATMGATLNFAVGSGFCGANLTAPISFTFSEAISSTGENCFKPAAISDASVLGSGYLWSFPASIFRTHDHVFGLSCSVNFDGVIRYFKTSSTSLLHVVGTMNSGGSETFSLIIQPTSCINTYSPIYVDCGNPFKYSEAYVSGDAGLYYIWFGSGNSSIFNLTNIYIEEAFPTAGETCELGQVLSQGDNLINKISNKRIKPPNCFPQGSGNIDYYKYTAVGNTISISAYPSDNISIKNNTSQTEKTCISNLTNSIKYIIDPGDVICFRIESTGAITNIYIDDQSFSPLYEIEPNNTCSVRTNLGIISSPILFTGTVSSLPCSTPDQYDYYEFIPANTGIYYFLFDLEATWGAPFASAHLYNSDCSAIVSPAGGWTIASSCNGSPYFPMTATAYLISNSAYVLEICDVWTNCEGAKYSSLIYQ